jgi:hypothetical protein
MPEKVDGIVELNKINVEQYKRIGLKCSTR